jgi:hypothetical protein
MAPSLRFPPTAHRRLFRLTRKLLEHEDVQKRGQSSFLVPQAPRTGPKPVEPEKKAVPWYGVE